MRDFSWWDEIHCSFEFENLHYITRVWENRNGEHGRIWNNIKQGEVTVMKSFKTFKFLSFLLSRGCLLPHKSTYGGLYDFSERSNMFNSYVNRIMCKGLQVTWVLNQKRYGYWPYMKRIEYKTKKTLDERVKGEEIQ